MADQNLILQPIKEPTQAADIIRELSEVLRKHNCCLLARPGQQFLLAIEQLPRPVLLAEIFAITTQNMAFREPDWAKNLVPKP